MIAFVRGNFVQKQTARVVEDVNGEGYDLQISLYTYSSIVNKESGQLFTYLHITENAHTLFGFAEMTEKDLFLQLISVSGVGTSTARMMLCGMKPEEITRAIVQGNTKQLESIKGIGRKSAERLIVELRDKFGKQNLDTNFSTATATNIGGDAANALVSLGIAKANAEQAVQKVIIANPEIIELQELIKQALKNL